MGLASGYVVPLAPPIADHAMFHNMVGGWHKPRYNNTLVGAHAYSVDGGQSWVATGIAFDLTARFTDGSTREFLRRERPHVVLDKAGNPAFLASGVSYDLGFDAGAGTEPSFTFVQPINQGQE